MHCCTRVGVEGIEGRIVEVEAYLGAEDSPLHRAIGAKWLISAVARIRQPGVKVDHTLVLEGEQGIKKTTLLEILASPELQQRWSDLMTKKRERWRDREASRKLVG